MSPDPLLLAALLVGCQGGEDAGPGLTSVSIGFELPAGQEDTRCLSVALPVDGDRFVRGFHARLPASSHHLLAYRAATDDEIPEPAPCQPFFDLAQGGAMLAFSQAPDLAVQYPDGVGLRVDAGQVLRLELHAINATEAPVHAEATLELDLVDPAGAALEEAGTFAWGTADIALAPGQSDSASAFFPSPDGEPLDVLAVATHQHRLGTRATVEAATSLDDDAPVPVYESRTWSEPPVLILDAPVHVDDAAGLRLTCEWRNTTDEWVGFGERARDEMCFAFGWYTPSRGTSFVLQSQ